MDVIPNILAERYASDALKGLWSPVAKIKLERTFWIAVLKAQQTLGLAIPDEAIEAYEAAVDEVDLNSIRRREAVSHHDVKAKIDEFCELAGHQHIHKGMTSRDLTENVEQLQVFKSLQLVRLKGVSALGMLAQRAQEYSQQPLTARTHNVAAQLTTLGKRLAMFGEELLSGVQGLDALVASYPFRGLKGAVGTQLDMLHLFDGDGARLEALDKKVMEYLGAPQALNAVGQVYPRSLDFRVVSVLYQMVAGPVNFATTLRLMAGHELISEGFAKGQVGSSAMPHKINPRSCERMKGFQTLLKGYLTMAGELSGDQWNEGDVSCSVVRRVLFPNVFFAIDGLLETFITILKNLEPFLSAIDKEVDHYLPFLMTTQFLMEAVKLGVGRERAHEAIKEHALAAVEVLRTGAANENDFIERLAGDVRVGLERSQLEGLLKAGKERVGNAGQQVEAFANAVAEWRERFPEAVTYKPEPIL